jgi:hypothetical protein
LGQASAGVYIRKQRSLVHPLRTRLPRSIRQRNRFLPPRLAQNRLQSRSPAQARSPNFLW